jgi:hypothetical protein
MTDDKTPHLQPPCSPANLLLALINASSQRLHLLALLLYAPLIVASACQQLKVASEPHSITHLYSLHQNQSATD